MSWLHQQDVLTQPTRLLLASPENVYRELKEIAQKPSHELRLRDDKIEALLVERKHPLINLGLASYGTNPEVYKALYRHSLEPPADQSDSTYKHGLRIGCLSNCSVPIVHMLFDFPRDLIGPDGVHRVLTNGDNRELDALLCNPTLSDKLLEELYQHTNAFASIPEERWAGLVYASRRNERLRTKDDEGDMPDMGYYSIHKSIFQLLETAPLDYRWLHILYALLDDLDFEKVPPPESINGVLERWTKLEGGEKPNGGYFTSLSLKEEFRCLIASLYGSAVAVRGSQAAKNVAIRCAYYGNARLTERELRAGYERDANVFAFAAMKNPALFLTTALRRAFEQDILGALDDDMTRRYLGRFELMKKRSPYLKSFLSHDHREKVAQSKEDTRFDAIQASLTGIDGRLNKLSEQWRTAQYWLIVAAVALGAILYFRR
jgi:hypothetical protein